MRTSAYGASEPPNRINHMAFVLDASTSMSPHLQALPEVADAQVQHLARLSEELDQETRVSIYTFGSHGTVRCLVYEKDVLRLPSIKGLYRIGGMTALAEATTMVIDDLGMQPEKYGEHAFLIYGLTDGQENDSPHPIRRALPGRIAALPEHWTMGIFVPDPTAVHAAKVAGFPAANIARWDATSAAGIAEVGETIRRTSDVFMRNREHGVRSYRGKGGLFQLKDFSAADVVSSVPSLTPGSYVFFQVPMNYRIDEFVQDVTAHPYVNGRAYYQLTKKETIQPQKRIAILVGGQVYEGPAARQVLGLPDHHVDVRPDHRPDCTIFVQSTSYNRKLIGGTELLLLR